MPKHTIVLIPGDGIGPEVTVQVRRVIDWLAKNRIVAFELDEDLVGGVSLEKTGEPITDAAMAKAMAADAVLFGAVGGPQWDRNPFECSLMLPASRSGPSSLRRRSRRSTTSSSSSRGSRPTSGCGRRWRTITTTWRAAGGRYFGSRASEYR